MLSAAKYLVRCSNEDRKLAKKLVTLGKTYGQSFFRLPGEPMMRLLEGRFVGLMRTKEEQIALLRTVASDMASELGLGSEVMFIRYSHKYEGSAEPVYEYTTALPRRALTGKRKYNQGPTENELRHCRWLYKGDQTKNIDDPHVLHLLGGSDVPEPIFFTSEGLEAIEKEHQERVDFLLLAER